MLSSPLAESLSNANSLTSPSSAPNEEPQFESQNRFQGEKLNKPQTHSFKHSLSEVWTTCYSRGEIRPIKVQVQIRKGLPRFDIIGLPQGMIREGRDRILAALTSLGVELSVYRILVSLNPGDIPKEGSHFDLPILVGVLKALGLLSNLSELKEFYWGELELNGAITEFDDALAHILFAQTLEPHLLISARRSSPFDFIFPYLVHRPQTLTHVTDLLSGNFANSPLVTKEKHVDISRDELLKQWIFDTPKNSGWDRLKGSDFQFEFWCLIMLGRHHVLLEGPPGVGKTSWCRAVQDLQRPIVPLEWHERFITQPFLSSQAKSLFDLFVSPFESPHHSSSRTSILGGGTGIFSPGCISRAHKGIVFLDELAEFPIDILESLREPLEEKQIWIGRKNFQQKVHADIQLLAALNPCKCGNHGSQILCNCTSIQYQAYQHRISGPLRDRFHFSIWWKFEDFSPGHQWKLKRVRERLVQAEQMSAPKIYGVKLPEALSPRRQKRWLDLLLSWSRWHGVTDISPKTVEEFERFLAEVIKRFSRPEPSNTN